MAERDATASVEGSADMKEEKLSDSTSANPAVTNIYSKQRIFKIIVIGDSNVGKTCLTFRLCSGRFPDKTEATIGVDFREKNLIVGGDSIKLQIWDTAGQERFRKSMVQHYYRNVHAVVFVYDITRRSSFDNLINWIDECDANNLGHNIPRILVGNKCDLQEDVSVPTNVAQCFSDNHGMPLFETSAKDGSQADHIESIFLTIAHKLKNSRPMKTSSGQAGDLVSSRYGQSHSSVRLNSWEGNQGTEPRSSCVCGW